ncbi:MAG: PEP-CTERM sorting domain-containing protein [Verrucomicrobiales bacterium]|jgi:hypothetical protein|nr:PEP-CTERM sorting domain-containing protein [Verrucomicrobiales bacterium]
MKTSKQIGKWLAMGALLLASGAGALAATSIWTGGGADDNWDTTGNWDNVPEVNDTINFGNLTPSVPTVSVDNNHADLLVGQINFSGTTAYTISGLVITSTNSNNVVINSSSVRQTISADFYSGWSANARTINGGAAGLEFAKYVNTVGDGNWEHNIQGTVIFQQFYIGNSRPQGGYNLSFTGNGTVIIGDLHASQDTTLTNNYAISLYNGQKMVLTGTVAADVRNDFQINHVNSSLTLTGDANANAFSTINMNNGSLINNSSVRLDKLTWKTGTLGGTGSILATKGVLATVNGTYAIAPGDINSVGKLSFTDENLVWDKEFSTVTYDWNFSDLNAAAGVGYDQIFVEQGFDLGVNTQYVLNLVGLGGATIDDFAAANPGATWDIISAGNGITNFESSRWDYELPEDMVLTLSADSTTLQLMLIPEPSTWLLLGGGVALLAFLRRRR